MTSRTEEEAIKKIKEDSDKRDNELSMLPKKQKIKNHGFIFLELFTPSEFGNLKKGLENIYSGTSQHTHDRRLNIIKDILKPKKSLSSGAMANLPCIGDKRFKGKVLQDMAFWDLPEHIDFIEIKIMKSLPSVVILQFQVLFDDKISEKMNEVVQKFHKTIDKKIETPKGSYITHIHPSIQKEKAITEMSHSLKLGVYNFIKNNLKGYFLSREDVDPVDVIPSFDVLSISFPKTSTKKKQGWIQKNIDFFKCFGIDMYYPFIYKKYFLDFNRQKQGEFRNHIILADYNQASANYYPSKEAEIDGDLGDISFDIFALERFVFYWEQKVIKMNLDFFQKLEKMKLGEAIRHRERILSSIFLYENITKEFENYVPIPDNPPFIDYKKTKLFPRVKEFLKERVVLIDKHISKIIKQSELFISLKNIKYNNKVQKRMFWLTLIILGATIMSGAITFITKPEIILKIFFNS
ncbi:hypothetical protein KAJ38_02560 [Candidatus Pacearchaeota archaeon]|nr:hypothetical protein [Candidatus Pacearchaeota archaeon]